MKVLIDKEEFGADKNGHVYYAGQPIAQHSTIKEHWHVGSDNFRVISGGHVYIMNYNKDTYTPLKPETFEEYQSMKKNGEKLWDRSKLKGS